MSVQHSPFSFGSVEILLVSDTKCRTFADTSLHLICLCSGGNERGVSGIQMCHFQQRGEDMRKVVKMDAAVLIYLYSTLGTKAFPCSLYWL